MKIEIFPPAGFSETGQRSNNEDSIYPLPGIENPENTLFLVCDGVGGQHKGEIASELVCGSVSDYFNTYPTPVADETYITQALRKVTADFLEKEREDPETRGMATTFTLLHFNEAGATMAHLGDSRIYQVRDGQVIRVSEDHKLVNELMKNGHITEQEARNHPQKNVITKVLAADRNDRPDVRIINDVAAGDYFFLCTDGVLENVYDELLAYHLRETPDNQLPIEAKLRNIRQECDEKTRDNYSAYLIQVRKVSGEVAEGYRFADHALLTMAQPLAKQVVQLLSYEYDMPTTFFKPSAQLPEVGLKTNNVAQSDRPVAKSRSRLVPYMLGALGGIIATAAGLIIQQQRQSPVKTAVAEKDTFRTLPVKVNRGKTEPKAAAMSKSEQTPTFTSPAMPIAGEVIAQSKRYRFSIIRNGEGYFTWEPHKKRKTRILYDDATSIPDTVHLYSFEEGGKYYLYVSKPDVRIEGVESASTDPNFTEYLKNGIKTKIGNISGQKAMAIEHFKPSDIKNSVEQAAEE